MKCPDCNIEMIIMGMSKMVECPKCGIEQDDDICEHCGHTAETGACFYCKMD